MGSIWCVRPEEVTAELVYTDVAGGRHPFWIKFKKQLTIGEDRHIMTAGWKGVSRVAGRADASAEDGGAVIEMDWKLQSLARAEIYLTDWSLEDDDHRKLDLRRETIEQLHPDVFLLIENAITAHLAAREQEKKATTGTLRPLAMSGS